MRSVLLLLGLAVLVAGCGQASGDTPGAEPDPTTTQEIEPDKDPEPPEGGIQPPPVVLVSDGGRQVGPKGSYCITNNQMGQGMCADAARPPEAEQANVVRPGETIAIVLEGARAVKAEGCGARDVSCIGEAQISPAGCKAATVARIFLERGAETRWRVQLEPGAYELQTFVYFETDDGSSGDVSTAFGLVVEPNGEPEIVPMPAAAAVCR